MSPLLREGIGVALLAVVALGCRTEPNPAYCDEARPCGDGRLCQMNRCVEIGGDGGDCAEPCQGATPFCEGGACVACRGHADCPAEAPLCSTAGACEPCASDEGCARLPDGAVAICTPSGACVRDGEVVVVDAEAACSGVAEPFCAVPEALTYAAANDRSAILLREAGRAYDRFEVHDQVVRIYGQATSQAGPTVSASAGLDAILVTGATSDVELHRLRVTGAARGVHCEDAARCLVHRVVARENGVAVYMDGVGIAEVTRSTLAFNNGGGIFLYRTEDHAVVQNNFIYKNGANSAGIGGLYLDGVLSADWPSWRVGSNSLLANKTDGSAGAAVHCAQPLTISSHIHWEHTGTPVGGACALEHSSTETLLAGAGNLAGDPHFVSTLPAEDLHLAASSPCRDMGALEAPPADDIDGDARDAQPDIGADELRP